MDELTWEVERELGDVCVELVLEIPINDIDGGETAIRSGHPDRWTQGYGPSVEFGDPIIKSLKVEGQPAEGLGEFRVGGTLKLTEEETEQAQDRVFEDCKHAADDAEVERGLEAMEDDYDPTYCKY